jgi:hypothetical protein
MFYHSGKPEMSARFLRNFNARFLQRIKATEFGPPSFIESNSVDFAPFNGL